MAGPDNNAKSPGGFFVRREITQSKENKMAKTKKFIFMPMP
jgi:hypothetical protein